VQPRNFLLPLLVPLLSGASAFGCGHRSAFIGGDPIDLDSELIPSASIRGRVILVGDAGVPDPDVIDLVSQWAGEISDRTLVVYLGDNIYPDGLPAEGEEGRDEAVRHLDEQLRPMLETGCLGLFVPGNHDWGVDGAEGMERVRRQSEYIEAVLGPDGFAPAPGCPGPESFRMWGFRVVAIDTEWWLRDGKRPAPPSPCPTSLADAEATLRAELEHHHAGDLTMIVAHHPLATHGPHGGYYDWKDHLFPLTNLHPALWVPLPGVGSLYPLARSLRKSDQDFSGDGNQAMREAISGVLTDNRPFIYANGHDHNLQLMMDKPWAAYSFTSGAGSKTYKITPVGKETSSRFAHSSQGFFVLDRLADGAVIMRVVEPPNDANAGREDGAVSGWWLR
jgi:hypothetical protein